MIDTKSFGQFIHNKRVEMGLTQKELADKLYVTEFSISKWETGKAYPDITRIPDICNVLGVSEHELISSATDLEYNNMKSNSERWVRLTKLLFYIPTFTYILALLICLICNITVNHTLSWFLTVLTSILVAFCFFPSFIRFFKGTKYEKMKLEIVASTSFISITLLLINCYVQYGNNTHWLGIALVSIFLGYIAFLLPFFLKKYIVENYKKYNNLIYFVALYIGTILLYLVLFIKGDIEFNSVFYITTYGFIPLFIAGALRIFKFNKNIKASIIVGSSTIVLTFIPKILTKIFGEAVDNDYTVNFSDWINHTTGNVCFLIILTCGITTLLLLTLGIIKTLKYDQKI